MIVYILYLKLLIWLQIGVTPLMMQTLRDKMKHIMLITLLAFLATIIFSWGMGGFKTKLTKAQQGIITVVNGTQLHYEQFIAAVNDQLDRIREQTGNNDIPEYQVENVRNQVWEQMVSEILIRDEIARQGIQISDEEIVYTLRNRPPDFIINNEQFQTDGKFDYQKYRQALENPNNYQAWVPVENYLRSVLPSQKIQQRILASVRVTDNELFEQYKLENEKSKVSYISFKTQDISNENILVSDDEIKKYYKENKEKFKVPEMRKIEYVLFAKKPSKEDTLQTYDDAKDIIEQLKNGADFAELAKDYSEDRATAVKGGDLGFFGRGEMVKPFEDAAFSAKIRKIIGPVKSNFGLHIIQVLAKKKEKGNIKVHARHILLKFVPSPETEENINTSAGYFYDEVTEKGAKSFKEIAESDGYKVNTPNAFPKGSFVPGLGMANRVNYLTFANKKGWISRPVTVNDNLVIFKITDIIGEHYKPLKDVEKTIQNAIILKKKKEECKKLANNFYDKLSKSVSFEDAAKADSLKISETNFFRWDDYIPQVGKNMEFTSAAFTLNKGSHSKPIETATGYFVLKVIEKQHVSKDNFKSAVDQIKSGYLQKKQRAFYMAWYNSLKAKAKIEDYREMFF